MILQATAPSFRTLMPAIAPAFRTVRVKARTDGLSTTVLSLKKMMITRVAKYVGAMTAQMATCIDGQRPVTNSSKHVKGQRNLLRAWSSAWWSSKLMLVGTELCGFHSRR